MELLFSADCCSYVPSFLQEPLLSASDVLTVLALNENGTWKILDEVCP